MPIARANNLDFIRTALALGVLSFHTFQYIGIDYPQLPWVPSFIALSGYLITESMQRSAGYLHFAWKRLLRVAPAFLLSLILVAALGGSISGALSDWIFMGQRPTYANPPLWSLSLEEVLYAALAGAFAIGIYRTSRRAAWGLLAIYLMIGIASSFASPVAFPLFYVASSFVSGSWLYIVKDRIPWSLPAAIICLAAAVTLRNSQLTESVLYTFLIGPLIAYALIGIAFYSPPVFARYKLIIGDPSFGIYIYHFPILVWLNAHGVAGLALYPATLIPAVMLALVSWHAIEKRALSRRIKAFGYFTGKYRNCTSPVAGDPAAVPTRK